MWSLLFFILAFAPLAHAQTAVEIQKSALRIVNIGDEKIVVQEGTRDKDKLILGQNVLVVRTKPDDDDFEIIAKGTVKAVAKGKALIAVEINDVKKLPEKSDFVVILGAPKDFSQLPKGESQKGPPSEPDDKTLPEPGYIAFQYLQISDSLKSDTPNQANSLKNINKFPRTGFELEWYLEFLSNYGIGFGQSNGAVPINSYYRQNVDGSYSEQFFKLNYRTNKHANFRGTFFFESLAEDFSTANPDQLVIATKSTSSNLGLALQYEPGDLLLKGAGSRFQFTYFRFQYLTSFSYQPKDGAVYRGTSSSGSQFTEMRFGANFTTYLQFVPWIKRYTISVDSFTRSRKLNFSGDTKADGFYTIPSNQQYNETETGLIIGIGVRFEDIIGRIFKPRT